MTHQLQFLQDADEIIILSNGKIEANGSYDQLRQSGLDFSKLLAAPVDNDDEKVTFSRSNSNTSQTSRQSSVSSTQSFEKTPVNNQMKVEETRAKGSIGSQLYKKYFKASGAYFMFYVMAFLCLMAQLLASGGDYYVSYW